MVLRPHSRGECWNTAGTSKGGHLGMQEVHREMAEERQPRIEGGRREAATTNLEEKKTEKNQLSHLNALKPRSRGKPCQMMRRFRIAGITITPSVSPWVLATPGNEKPRHQLHGRDATSYPQLMFLRIIGHVERGGIHCRDPGREHRDSERLEEAPSEDSRSLVQTGKSAKSRGGSSRRLPATASGERQQPDSKLHNTEAGEAVLPDGDMATALEGEERMESKGKRSPGRMTGMRGHCGKTLDR